MKAMAKKVLLFYLTGWIIAIGGLPYDASAMLAPAPSEVAVSSADTPLTQTTLESKLIAQRLTDLGLDQAEVEQRLSSLNEEQIHQVAQHLDSLKPGGELILILAIIGAIVVVLALIGLAKQA
jgi:hypothetical protein